MIGRSFLHKSSAFLPNSPTHNVVHSAKKLHLAWRQDEIARYWKVHYPNNWEGETITVQAVQFICEEKETRKKAPGMKAMSNEHSAQLGRLCSMFDEKELLNDEQKTVRQMARLHGVNLGDAETLRIKFDKYDEDNSGTRFLGVPGF